MGPPSAGTVVHSDRGSQFRSRWFLETLRRHGLTDSNGQRGLHAGVRRVPDDPPGIDILHRTEAELVFTVGVLGNVRQPRLVRCRGGEVPLDQVIMDWWSRLPVKAAFLRKHRPDAVVTAQALDPVLASHDALPGELVGDEPVSEGGIVDVDVCGCLWRR